MDGTIGTDGRDFSTIAEFLVQADPGDVGTIYNDSVFDEAVDIDVADVTLTVADDEWHEGTAGAGARIVNTGGDSPVVGVSATGVTIERLEVDGNQTLVASRSGVQTAQDTVLRRLLVHGIYATISTLQGITRGPNLAGDMILHNSAVWDVVHSSRGSVFGVRNSLSATRNMDVYNVTLHGVTGDHDTETPVGLFNSDDDADNHARNVVVTDVINLDSGGAECFNLVDPAEAVYDHNGSSDATASGTGSLTGLDPADLYVSTSPVDLRVKDALADIFRAGIKLNNDPAGVGVDVTGYDRDAAEETPSMGAYQGEFDPIVGGQVAVAMVYRPGAQAGAINV